jgi:hypothetical protein
MSAMKPFVTVGILILFLLGAIGCEDKRVPPLEKRVTDLEVKMKDLEQERTKAAEAQSQKNVAFNICVGAANDEYQSNVRSNGTKSGAAYSLPVVALREIERHKQNKIEECKLLYR